VSSLAAACLASAVSRGVAGRVLFSVHIGVFSCTLYHAHIKELGMAAAEHSLTALLRGSSSRLTAAIYTFSFQLIAISPH
jgi:hypothetical protein